MPTNDKPVTEEEYIIAEELNKRQAASLWNYADSGMDPQQLAADQDYSATRELHDYTRDIMQKYETDNLKKDSFGKVTEVPKALTPVSDKLNKKYEDNNDFYFEPSVDEAKHALKSDPSIATRASIEPGWLTDNRVEERNDPVHDTMTGEVAGYNVTPAQSYLDTLSKDDKAYQRYADWAWEQKRDEAYANGKLVQRYKWVNFDNQPGKYIRGGAEKIARNDIAPAALGAAQGLSLGQAEPLYDAARDLVDYETKGKVDLPSSEEVTRRNPFAHTVGHMATYTLGANPTNLLQRGLFKAAGAGLNKLAAGLGESLAGRVASSAVSAGVSNAIEGALGDTSRAMGDETNDGFLASLDSGVRNVGGNLAFGTALGSAGHAYGEGLGALRGAARNAGTFNDLRQYEEGGGKMAIGRGIEPSPEMDAYIDQGNKTNRKPEDIAARELAPKIEDKLAGNAQGKYEKIAAVKDQYYAHPYYGTLKTNSKPIVDELVNYARKLAFEKPKGRQLGFTDPKKVAQIGDQLDNLAHPQWMEANDAAVSGGIVIDDPKLSRALRTPGKNVDPRDVLVLFPADLTAQKIEGFEEMIDESLGFARQATTKDNPVFKGMNRAIKSMRDQFPAYRDDAGNLIDPPNWPPMPKGGGAGPSAPPKAGGGGSLKGLHRQHGNSPATSAPQGQRAPQAPPSSIPSTDISVQPSSTMQVGSNEIENLDSYAPLRDSEIQLEPETDAIPLQRLNEPGIGSSKYNPAEELTSKDFEATGEELNTQDFELSPAEKRVQENRRLKGPVPDDYQTWPEYEEARRNWRVQNDQGHAGDIRSVHQQAARMQADAMPPTPKGPDSASLAPDTRRSISPPEEDTPLSRLAGNKLAMDEGPSIDDAVSPATEKLPPKSDEDLLESALAPGRSSRSGESQRMNDMLNQREAFDAAEGQIQNVEGRLGKLDDESRMKSILSMVSKKLGREVTKEDLIRAGLIGSGVAAMATSDGEEGEAAGSAAVLGGIFGKNLFGKGKKSPSGNTLPPTQPMPQFEATLPGGKKYKGLSALRHNQNDALKEMELLEGNVGQGDENLIIDRVSRYGRGMNNINQDDAILEVVKELGLEKELKRVTSLALHGRLQKEAFGIGKTGSPWRWILGGVGPRLDKGLEILGGEPRNPFYTGPGSAAGRFMDAAAYNPIKELLNPRGGRVGARLGDEAYRAYKGSRKEEREEQ